MNSRLSLLTGSTLLALLPLGCAGARPVQPVAAPAFKVPPACEVPLGGPYRHAKDPEFRYRGVDDGRKLELSLLTPRNHHQGLTDTPRIEVVRSADGFRGETRASGLNGEQRPCPLVFPTEVIACDAEGLTLRTVRTSSIDERCQALNEAAPRWIEQRLLRETAP